MEHILTRDVETRLSNLLGVDMEDDSNLFCHEVNVNVEPEPDFLPLTNLKEGKTAKVRIILENNEMTKTLEQAGLSPGNTILLKKSKGSSYDIETESTTLSLDEDIAAKIIVQN